MDKGLYVGMNGAMLAFNAQAIHANNLANSNTVGFRSDKPQFIVKEIDGKGFNSISHATSNDVVTDFSPGTIVSTGRNLDVAIEGNGWFVVQNEKGQERLTRAGEFQIDGNGILTNSKGMPVMGNGGPVAIPPAEQIEIGSDGSITIRPKGASENALTVIDRLKLANPSLNNLRKTEEGLFKLPEGVDIEVDGAVRVQAGAIESSNVSAINEYLHIMSLSRGYEMQLKIMTTYKDIDEQSSVLLRVE